MCNTGSPGLLWYCGTEGPNVLDCILVEEMKPEGRRRSPEAGERISSYKTDCRPASARAWMTFGGLMIARRRTSSRSEAHKLKTGTSLSSSSGTPRLVQAIKLRTTCRGPCCCSRAADRFRDRRPHEKNADQGRILRGMAELASSSRRLPHVRGRFFSKCGIFRNAMSGRNWTLSLGSGPGCRGLLKLWR